MGDQSLCSKAQECPALDTAGLPPPLPTCSASSLRVFWGGAWRGGDATEAQTGALGDLPGPKSSFAERVAGGSYGRP